MFEEHRERKVARAYQDALAKWEERCAGLAELLQLAQTYGGSSSTEIMLASGEAVFYQVTGASLIEDRRGQGHYEGTSTGVSIPVGSIGGRSVRYRVGANRGHYVQGSPVSTAIDTGTLNVTNHRVVFQGGKQTRECVFTRLVGFRHDDEGGSTTFSVSNRQKSTTVHYGPELSGAFDFRLDLALAHYRSQVSEFVAQLQADLTAAEAERPVNPTALARP